MQILENNTQKLISTYEIHLELGITNENNRLTIFSHNDCYQVLIPINDVKTINLLANVSTIANFNNLNPPLLKDSTIIYFNLKNIQFKDINVYTAEIVSFGTTKNPN